MIGRLRNYLVPSLIVVMMGEFAGSTVGVALGSNVGVRLVSTLGLGNTHGIGVGSGIGVVIAGACESTLFATAGVGEGIIQLSVVWHLEH